jgi:Protein of unknown function (DUF2384)
MSTVAASFPEFLNSLKEPSSRTALSPSLLAEALDLPAQRFASLARVHRNTLQQAPTSPKVQDAIRDVVRVLSAAHELSGDIDQAVFWFRNHPIAEFSHKTALELVEAGKAQAVVDYIESCSAGASG